MSRPVSPLLHTPGHILAHVSTLIEVMGTKVVTSKIKLLAPSYHTPQELRATQPREHTVSNPLSVFSTLSAHPNPWSHPETWIQQAQGRPRLLCFYTRSRCGTRGEPCRAFLAGPQARPESFCFGNVSVTSLERRGIERGGHATLLCVQKATATESKTGKKKS